MKIFYLVILSTIGNALPPSGIVLGRKPLLYISASPGPASFRPSWLHELFSAQRKEILGTREHPPYQTTLAMATTTEDVESITTVVLGNVDDEDAALAAKVAMGAALNRFRKTMQFRQVTVTMHKNANHRSGPKLYELTAFVQITSQPPIKCGTGSPDLETGLRFLSHMVREIVGTRKRMILRNRKLNWNFPGGETELEADQWIDLGNYFKALTGGSFSGDANATRVTQALRKAELAQVEEGPEGGFRRTKKVRKSADAVSEPEDVLAKRKKGKSPLIKAH